jgi:site-specific DNA-methyltransferase (adenine-specific)
MEGEGFSFKDMLAWTRERAPHRAQRLSLAYERRGDKKSMQYWDGWRIGNLRPTFEPILWFTKPYKIGSTIADNALLHGVGPFNEKAFQKYTSRPDDVLDCGFAPKEAGLHPTQKPVRLLTTQLGQLVFDPFVGSGSTLVAAKSLGRSYLGNRSKRPIRRDRAKTPEKHRRKTSASIRTLRQPIVTKNLLDRREQSA